MPSACLFNPSPEDTDRVLHRFADHEVSFHDIADEFKTTVPALVLWLARPDIAQRIADLRSAGAERTRTIAALYLPRTIPVLMRIIDSHDHDIGHRLDDPRDPATPILKLRERESVRKAITLIYRLASFTGIPTPAPTRAASAVASTSSRCQDTAANTTVPRVTRASELPVRSASESPAPRAIEVAVLGDFDAGSDSPNTRHAEGVAVHSPGWRWGGEATPWETGQSNPDPAGVRVASDLASTADSRSTSHASLITSHPSPIPPDPFALSAPSRSNKSTPRTLLERAGSAPRRSRAGPPLQEVA